MVSSRTNQLIVEAAARLGASAQGISRRSADFFLRLATDERAVLVSKTRSPFLTQVAQTLVNNKFVARERLGVLGLPTMPCVLLDAAIGLDDREVAAFVRNHPRLVVKPNWGNRGWGVSLDVSDRAGLERAIERAAAVDRVGEVLLEPHLDGTSVRVCVIGGRATACVAVRRPKLVGDGVRTVREIIDELNADPRRGAWDGEARPPLDPIALDRELDANLARFGLAFDDVLALGKSIVLVTDELEVEDKTDALHPGWGRIAEDACAQLGADVAGVDFIGLWSCFEREPALSLGATDVPEAAMLEVNVLPALHLHALPTIGEPRPVFDEFVRYCLQLPGAPPPAAQIPI